MNRRLTKAFIGALSFAAALSTAVVCNASDAQAKKASVKKVTASAPSGKKESNLTLWSESRGNGIAFARTGRSELFSR